MLAAGAGCCGAGAPVLDHGDGEGDGDGPGGWGGDQDGDSSLAGQQLPVLVSVAADPSVWARCQISADILLYLYSEKSFRLQLNFLIISPPIALLCSLGSFLKKHYGFLGWSAVKETIKSRGVRVKV